MPAEIKGSLARTARRQYRGFCRVMEKKRVYSHFQLDSNGILQCVFSPEPGLLLGETVRDWIWKSGDLAEDPPQHFLWCEKFEDDEFAMVYVQDGRVYRESFTTARTVQMESEQLVRRGQVHDPDFRIFLCGLEPAEVGLTDVESIFKLDLSVLEHAGQSRQNLPQVSSYRKAISRVADAARFRRIAIVAVALAAALAASYYGIRWFHPVEPPPVVPVDGVAESADHLALVQAYSDLLTPGDAGDILLALHGAIVRFITEPVFGAYWLIEEAQWRQGDSQVLIQATLLTGDSPPEDEGEEMSATRQTELQKAAEALGWTLAIDRFSGTFRLPVDWDPRTQEQLDDLPQSQPDSSEGLWHFERLVDDMRPIGALEKDENGASNGYFHTESFVLNLSQDPWLTGETAKWLGRRLGGGPTVLDAVSLQSAPAGSGVFMDLTIKFRLVWRTEENAPVLIPDADDRS